MENRVINYVGSVEEHKLQCSAEPFLAVAPASKLCMGLDGTGREGLG